jgi:putative NIF3 family GTP cyclohydrolase 1 type 2
LGAVALEPFALHHGEPIGFIARLPGEGMAAGELVASIRAITSREPLVFEAGPEPVRTVAIVSGAGASFIGAAAAAGADALLTGEPAERVMAQAREFRLHFIAAGHYATETLGVRRLGEHLAQRFALRHVFLDVPNPV